jgi:hypothetical protein
LASLTKVAPALIIILGVGIAGFVMSLGWSKVAGGGWDRDKIVFLAKMWGGIVLAFFVIAFIA